MVMWVRHLHAVLYPFFVFPAVNIAPLVLGPGVRARSSLPNNIKFLCRRAGRFASLSGSSLGFTDSGVSGAHKSPKEGVDLI